MAMAKMKQSQAMLWHRILAPPAVLGLMYIFNDFGLTACLFLALHSALSLCWLIKYQLFPDIRGRKDISAFDCYMQFFSYNLYLAIPYIAIAKPKRLSYTAPPDHVVALAVFFFILGFFLNFCADAQLKFTLGASKDGADRLITSGFFAACRSPHYLGEIIMNLSLALLCHHFAAVVIVVFYSWQIFVPIAIAKDAALFRHYKDDFEKYRRASGLLFPYLNLSSNQRQPAREEETSHSQQEKKEK